MPAGVNVCIHELILERCRDQPKAQAVCGPDGTISYAELDQYSSELAFQLISQGVGRGTIVPLLFEKSSWCAVALLAVLKTGAAFVMLDRSHPISRLKEICLDTQSKVVVSSQTCLATAHAICPQVMAVDAESIRKAVDGPQLHHGLHSVLVGPEDLAYVVCTSGSTGKPKKIMIPHGAISTSMQASIQRLDLKPGSRVFQFASYAWDVSVSDHLLSLIAGACICVPREHERTNDPTKAARDLLADWAFVTPSVIALLDPDGVPSLKTLVSGGEPLTKPLVKKWARRVNLINVYGPAECAVLATTQDRLDIDADPTNVGRPLETACWVVDAEDDQRLLPIGHVGELLLEGPTVGRGYLNNPQQTAAAFIEPPPWLTAIRAPFSPGRLYKTGDLARFASDGTIHCLGRKDRQVKVHGQRLELGEVEHQIEASFADINETAVELIKLKRQNGRQVLVSFVCPRKGVEWGDFANEQKRDGFLTIPCPTEQFYSDLMTLDSRLRAQVPAYMVPYAFIPVMAMPLTISGKTNLSLLRDEVSTWSPDRLAIYNLSRPCTKTCQRILTNRHRQISKAVSDVLNLDVELVDMNSNFFALGGDSLSATKLVAAAKGYGLHLTVPLIFTHPILGDLADELDKAGTNGKWAAPHLLEAILPACTQISENVSRRLSAEVAENVLEVLPATEFQCLSARQMRYRHFQISLPPTVDRDRLRDACQRLVDTHSVLRTVFVFQDTPEGASMVQLVLRRVDVRFSEYRASSLAQHCYDDTAGTRIPPDGELVFQPQMVTLEDSSLWLVLRLPHVQYDGLSLAILSEDLSAAYNGLPIKPTTSFASHVRAARATRTDEAYVRWREVLEGSQMTTLNGYSVQLHKDQDSTQVKHVREDLRMLQACRHTARVSLSPGITLATLIKVAWAMTLKDFITLRRQGLVRKGACSDIVFGQVVHGRTLGIPCEDRIVGPCLKIVPVRVHFTEGTSKDSLLRQVQAQHIHTMPFQSLELKDIVKHCTQWPLSTEFGSFVRVQNFEDDPTCWLEGVPCQTQHYSLPNHPWDTANVHVMPRDDELVVTIMVSSNILGQRDLDCLTETMCTNIQSLGV